MKTIVLGGGVIGITTAYYLNKLGHDVVVLERNTGVGEETSFQNGALLAPGHSQSWAAPGALATLLQSFFQKHPALRFRLSLDPQFWRWVMQFLANCNQRDFNANTLRTFRCMNQGLIELRALQRETGLQFDQNDNGILYLFRSDKSFAKRKHDWTMLQQHGLQLRQVNPEECVTIEPALGSAQNKISGGFFSPNEAAGDSYLFSKELAEFCIKKGVQIKYETTISNIEYDKNRVVKVNTSEGSFSGDSYVLALGPYAAKLASTAGIKLPIWPVKGYTVTIPTRSDDIAPTTGIIEEDNLVSFAHLGDRFRFGSEAEFAGYDQSFTEKNYKKVLAVAKDLFPNLGDYDNPRYWACLRPVSAAGPPILGESQLANLFLNVGHGSAGWTQACATSRAVAEIVNGQQPDLDMEGLRLGDL